VSAAIRISRAGPAMTIQDRGRFGMLRHGVSESGPMDRGAFARAGAALPIAGGEALEFSRAGLAFAVESGHLRARAEGGDFRLAVNGAPRDWPANLGLDPGDGVEITPGPAGNYGYLRFDHHIGVPAVLGSRATNLVVGLGGLDGRALRAGDRLTLVPAERPADPAPASAAADEAADGPIRFVWGIHADLFTPGTRHAFVERRFVVSPRLDRMGVRLEDRHGVFAGAPILSLVSDAIVAGDVQVLGDGTPIVLMRDHQPTGGYPRIATIIAADLDRFAQLRPGRELAFAPVCLHKAHQLYRAGAPP
jgi:biotin-dependent carboxylase-like uncharacterized protein